MSKNKKLPLLVLLGPTASGKTDLAMALSDVLPLSLISVDSALIYNDMNIGTGKPSPELLAKYPHALINLRNPDEHFSVADFVTEAKLSIAAAHQAGKIPCLVGGTMMYYKALLFGLSDLPATNPELRAQLQQTALEQGLPALHTRLQSVDPKSAARIHMNDTQRTLRALEVFESTGIPLSDHFSGTHGISEEHEMICIGLTCDDRTLLHQRIADRFDHMLAQGLIEEVRALRERYTLSSDLPAMRSVGYRQAWAYLDGHINHESLRETGIAATRQLAKRQFTWLKTWPNLHHLPMYAHDLSQKAQLLLSDWPKK
ncbi:MAG: tRNA (adenosine(37)-N6)-dimethylallyltransferase MiaA [Pseudomonadota bacterium]